MLCPYCKTELEKREDGSYECPNCKTKIKPLASEQTAEKADDKSQGEANEVEQLKKRIATLEENSLQSKVKKAAGAATTYVKGNWKWLLPVVLAVLLFIILMVSFVGLRGIYVNVNDPNDFMDFGVSKYTAYSTDELGQAYVESGKYTLSGSKLTLKVKDSDFGDLKEEFAVRVSTGYNSLKLILDGDEVIEYKRVSIVGYKTTAEKVTVTFDPCNGQDPKKFKVKIGSSLGREIDAPANGSQRFLGWYNERNGYRSETAMAYKKDLRIWEDTTFYASWPLFEVDENGVLYQVDKNYVGEELRIPANVRSIGENVFADCTQIKSVYIPAGVQEMHDTAFSGCTNIVSVAAPVNLLSRFDNLESAYVLSGSLDGTYSLSSNLKNLQISDSVTDINLSNIELDALERISVDNGNPNWTSYDGILYPKEGDYIAYVPKAIKGAISVLEGCEFISGKTFFNCANITSITIPSSMDTIMPYAFENCASLQTVNWNAIDGECHEGGYWKNVFIDCPQFTTLNIGESVKIMPRYVFHEIFSLQTVNWNATNCTEAGDGNYHIFRGCTGLATVNIGENVENIPNYTFSNCTGLRTVNWNATNCTMAGNWRYPIFKDCTGLATVNIGDNVESIPNYAFSGCTGITKVVVSSLKGWCEIEFGYDANPLREANGKAKLYVKENGGDREVTGAINIPDGTTKIGDGAFYGLTGITSVTIPDSVISIGNEIFEGCTDITTATMPANAIYCIPKDNLNAVTITSGEIDGFFECTSLQTVTIGAGVTSIGIAAFSDCTGLQTVTIGDGVTSIGERAFQYCTKLQTVTIGSGVTSIGEWTFNECTGITRVNYLGDLKGWCEIVFEGYYANPLYDSNLYASKFVNSAKAKLYVKENGEEKEVKGEVTIPVGTTKIGTGAFSGLNGITSVTIPDSVESIGKRAFYYYTYYDTYCTKLQTVTLGSGVKSIGEDAFNDCIFITKVNYLGDLKSWCEIEFENSSANPLNGKAKLYVKENGIEKEVAGEVNIPVGTTKIGVKAFYKLIGITSVTIPDSVTSIGDYAFSDCAGLQTVTIGEGVTSIGNYAFNHCTHLQAVTIGKGVQSIGKGVFYDCTRLKDIYYTGGAEQWGQIPKGNHWDQYYSSGSDYQTINYQMHYNSTWPSAAASAEDAEYDEIARLFEEVEALRCTDEGKHAIAA